MKRKTLNLFFFCALSFTLIMSGCSNTKTGSDSSGKKEAEKVTLTVWGDQGGQEQVEPAFDKINSLFMEKHPNIQIDYQYSGTLQSIDTAVRSNSLPDLFWVQGNKTPMMELYVESGALLPLDEFNIDTSRYPKEAVEYGTVKGTLYSSLPAFMDSQLIYYNKEIFKKHGLEVPKTFQEFVDLFDALKKEGVTPMAMPGKDEVNRSWLGYALMPALAHDSLDRINKGEGDFSDPNIIKAFQTIQDFANKGYFNKDFVSTDMTGAQLSFTNGDTAMTADGTWSYSAYKNALDNNLGTFYIPNMDGKKVAPLSYGQINTYAVSANTKHPEEAAEYIKFLSSQEAQQIIADELGFIPTLDDLTPKSEDIKALTQYDSLGHNVYSVLTNISTEEVAITDLFLREAYSGLLTGKLSAEETAKLLNEALEKTK
jgi:raffinose/stachyose/melibiose transport system substrate-binding protein